MFLRPLIIEVVVTLVVLEVSTLSISQLDEELVDDEVVGSMISQMVEKQLSLCHLVLLDTQPNSLLLSTVRK